MELLLVVALFLSLTGLTAGILMLFRFPSTVPAIPGNSEIPPMTVIIPARNEESRIRPLLESLHTQSPAALEILVVDDNSSDRTADVARSYGARVLESGGSSEAMAGKSSACQAGADAASGEWLLFLDADTRLTSTDSLARLAAAYRALGRRGLLSVQPFHRIVRPFENLSAVFNVVVVAGMNFFVPSGWRLKPAGAFGACILCNKKDYDSTGGHAAIREALMDDLAIGQAFLSKGLPVHGVGGKGLIDLRMYPDGLRSLMDGWTKSIGTGASSTHPAVTLLINAWITGALLPLFMIVFAIWAGNPGWAIAGGLMYAVYGLQIHRLARLAGNFNPLLILLYPFHLLFFTFIFLRSLYFVRIRRRVSWRGRTIKL
ncbi:glycosyltransferase [Bhargavaea ullalensis]|uniref:4,4'-diaponeurosporenoate glycosyltransferase n=1 Tax=Bhargavaea ullalensis TaxID=1265685 RepID=A0ABV2G7X5_9BACL